MINKSFSLKIVEKCAQFFSYSTVYQSSSIVYLFVQLQVASVNSRSIDLAGVHLLSNSSLLHVTTPLKSYPTD